MFNGTRFTYKILYFVTAMSPAYFLFLLQMNGEYSWSLDLCIRGVEYKIQYIYILLSLLILSLSIFLKVLLKKQVTGGYGRVLTDKEVDDFYSSNIEEVNGSVVSFLMGNILPVVIITDVSANVAILTFIILQIIIFNLMLKSSDIFPNIILIMLGLDICKTKSGKYLFILRGKDKNMQKVFQIGDVKRSNIYITEYKK